MAYKTLDTKKNYPVFYKVKSQLWNSAGVALKLQTCSEYILNF